MVTFLMFAFERDPPPIYKPKIKTLNISVLHPMFLTFYSFNFCRFMKNCKKRLNVLGL
jgi:hypothetical protein